MATKPIACPPVPPNGFLFLRSDLILEENSKSFDMEDLSDFFMDVTSFATSRYRLSPGNSILISQSDIGDDDGYVRFLAFRIYYPDGTSTLNKYCNWSYRGKQYNIGELMILTGNRFELLGYYDLGWKMTSQNPLYEDGGILIENPHSDISVTVELLIAR